MKAAVCYAHGEPLAIQEVSIADPGPGEVKVRLAACAICHSDISYADGAWGGELPAVYGHEASGKVEMLGANVSGLAVGDHVVVTLIRSCGHCFYCSKGAPTACETKFPLDDKTPLLNEQGSSIIQGLRTGAFAEYVVVASSQIVSIPKDIPLDSAALLACSVVTGVGAVANTASVTPGSTVCVIGAGGVGLNTIQGAVIVGALNIIAIDINEVKLDAARNFGATHCINSLTTNVVDTINNITNDRGVDYVFVTVGVKNAFEQAYKIIGNLGVVVLVGMPPDNVMTEFEPGDFANAGQMIIGSKMGSSRIDIDIPYLVGLYKQGRLKLDELISGRYQLEEINEAIQSVKNGMALRNILIFKD